MSKKQSKNLVLGGTPLTIEDCWEFAQNPGKVELHPSVRERLDTTRKVVEECLTDGLPHYGINTGFGSLANTRIADDKLEELQYNLVRSHACGVGEPFPADVTRLIMLLRANVLAMGHSGVRYQLLEQLVELINSGSLPVIPSQGSVGASGDLAPLAHLALALLDRGVKLEAKEGLSLINGIQASLAVAIVALRDAWNVFDHANMALALSVEGMRGSANPFDKRIADVRPAQSGHAEISKQISAMIAGSEIIASHKGCSRVQDPYSLRCTPQVHGAILDTLNYVTKIIEGELQSCTDNPLIFDHDIISGGNFHGTSIGLACDCLAAAFTALGNISERRIEQMINPKQGELKYKYLSFDAGVNSGFMVAHVTASALASENKALSLPASSDSVTTSGGQEDFVSMAMWAARKLQQLVKNVESIIAIELLSGAQAIDLHEEKLEAGAGTKKIYSAIRKVVPTLERDRVLYIDIEKVRGLMTGGNLRSEVL